MLKMTIPFRIYDNELNWSASYLTDREQVRFVNDYFFSNREQAKS